MSDKSIHVSAAAADAADTFKGREEAKKVVHSSVRRMHTVLFSEVTLDENAHPYSILSAWDARGRSGPHAERI